MKIALIWCSYTLHGVCACCTGICLRDVSEELGVWTRAVMLTRYRCNGFVALSE